MSASWCSNCGLWGWDFMEALKEEFSSGPALPLGVHDSGDLQNETAVWWSQNLNAIGQPRFYINNEAISVGSGNWTSLVEPTVSSAEALALSDEVQLAFSSIAVDEENIDVSIDIESMPVMSNTIFLGVYVYENNVINFQSQQGPDAIHPNILRTAMTDNIVGIPVTSLGLSNFNVELDPTWKLEELGVLAVLWEEQTSGYTMLGSKFISQISGLSSNENILNSADFTFSDHESALLITTEEEETYQLQLTDMQGRLITSAVFNKEIHLSKNILSTGMYILSLKADNKVLTQQIFVR